MPIPQSRRRVDIKGPAGSLLRRLRNRTWGGVGIHAFFEEGHMLNASFLDYRMPTSLDLPMIDTVIGEVANPTHPYGVRGVGETPIIPPMAAVSNAIYHAVGVRVDQLPMSPGRVLEALWAHNGAKSNGV